MAMASFLLSYFTKGMMKGGNKQEEAWINPFVKQFSNISFSVSIFSLQFQPLLVVVHNLSHFHFFVFFKIILHYYLSS
jgi:hypothetical protein